MQEPRRAIRPHKGQESALAPPGQESSEVPQSFAILSKVSKPCHQSSACVSCRNKRRRCSGAEAGRCSGCRKLGIECVFDKNSDGRRKPQRERSKKEQALLHRLIETIKHMPEHEIGPFLVHPIRHEGASVPELPDLLESIPTQRPPTIDQAPKTLEDLAEDSQDNLQDDLSSAVTGSESLTFRLEQENLTASVTSALDESHSRMLLCGGPFVSPGPGRQFQTLQVSDSIATNQYPPEIQREQIDLSVRPEYNCTPLILDKSSHSQPLAASMLRFLYTARSRVAAGDSVPELLSTDGIDLELYFRERTAKDPHTVSTWACEFAKASTFNYQPLTLRMNTIYSVGTFMRWLILPCQATWDQMNPLMRPLQSQVLCAHDSVYADLCHIPQLRLAELRHGRGLEWLIAKQRWVDCHFDDRNCIEWVGGRPKRLSSEFVKHICDVRVWTVDRSALSVFPELAEADNKVALHDDELSQ